MRWRWRTIVVGAWLGLAACVGVNPEWDEPAGVTAWVPASRCEATGTEGDDGDEGDEVARDHEGDESSGDGACGAVEPDACGEGLTVCASAGGWFCVDLRENDGHCGDCFNECAAYGDATCVDGECSCRGGPWWRLCGDHCADTRTDPAGCGIECVDCQAMYGPDARCETGICKPATDG